MGHTTENQNLKNERFTEVRVTTMRKTIAQRLGESQFSAPHFYLRTVVNMDNVITVRKKINEKSPIKISINDYIIRACAMALTEHPHVNSTFLGEVIRMNHHIDIGVAVAVPDGLITPIVRDADKKTLCQIAETTVQLATKAKEKKLHSDDYTGNTFTISNLGMMGVDEFTAIVNPPASCILAVGKIAPEFVPDNEGNPALKHRIRLTLTSDHRVVDGAISAQFMQSVKKFLENPKLMNGV